MREFMVVKPHPVAMIQTPSGEYIQKYMTREGLTFDS